MESEKNYQVSVIIPAYNEEVYLPKLLQSLRNQKNIPELEIIVAISPKTTDNTLLLAERYDCKIVEGGRPAKARNNGAMYAGKDILFFIDADTHPTNDYFLSRALEEFQTRNLDLAGVLLSPDFQGNFLKKTAYRIIYGAEMFAFLKKEKSSRPVMQSGMFFKKDAFFSLSGFTEEIFREDSDIAERAVKHNPKFNFGILRNCGSLKNSVRRYETSFWKNLFKILYLNAKVELFGYKSVKDVINSYFDK